jgi:uncharacterized membrane protein
VIFHQIRAPERENGQTRQAEPTALANKRADLDLQVSLLAEHEITHLVALVTEIERRVEAQARRGS